MASLFLGKYAIEDKVILVSKANVERIFREASLEGKEREDLLLYVLLHELVHAWQDRKYGLFGRIEAVRTAEDLMVFNAMAEGHAEFVSRRGSAKAGFSEADRRSTPARWSSPKDPNPPSQSRGA